MDQRNLKSRFTKLRVRRRTTGLACLKLSRNRPSSINMEKLVKDLNAALDETDGPSTSNITNAASLRACRRRSKSTSNIVFVSDDTNSSMDLEKIEISRDSSSPQLSDSDIERARGLSLKAEMVGTIRKKQTKILEFRDKKGVTENLGIESDSVTENISPIRELMGIYNKRHRKYKRMSVDPILRSVYVGRNKRTKRKKVRSRSDTMVVRSTCNKEDGEFSSKRKRSARDRSVESAVFIGTSSSSMFEEEKIDMKGLSSSSSLSSSDWEEIREGPEMDADDEQSDWPGIEPRLSGMQLSDEEDPTISYSNQECPIGQASGKVLKSRNTILGNHTVFCSNFAVPNTPDSLNEVIHGERRGADCKRQRRSTPSLADTTISQ